MRNFKRSERVRSQMLRDVRELLDQECLVNLHGLVTFTEVEITDDLKFAKILYSVLGSDKDKNDAAGYFGRNKKRIQAQLGRMLKIKFIPEVSFEFDPSIERGDRITRIISGLSSGEKDEPERKS